MAAIEAVVLSQTSCPVAFEDVSICPLGGVFMYERISIDPKVCHGQACIKGTRVPVHQIVRMLANGNTIEELLADYPSLEREDILACLRGRMGSLNDSQQTQLPR
jgi:uncharacterized protein (DUF433 family)